MTERGTLSPARQAPGWARTRQSGARPQHVARHGWFALGRCGAVVGAAAVVGVVWAAAVWAQPPERSGAQVSAPVWTSAADAPARLLTPLEAERHDRFIERAKAGGIDLVFFGTTDTEMWSWADRGRPVWDRAFASLRAANFGSQGTRAESLLWRMQHGELAGYQARVVVLQGIGAGDPAIPAARLPLVIAEIRARQPQARILLFAPFPRGQSPRAGWQQQAQAHAAAVAALVDDETVFYVDIGDRFFRPDGAFNDEMWSLDLANRGRQTPAFEVWADALRPWIARFIP